MESVELCFWRLHKVLVLKQANCELFNVKTAGLKLWTTSESDNRKQKAADMSGKALEQWKKQMDQDSSDSDDEMQMMEEYLKQRKLMKKMKKEQAVQKRGKTEVGDVAWERSSDVQETKWGANFEFQKGMFGQMGVRGGIGYESRSEKKSVKAVAKFPF